MNLSNGGDENALELKKRGKNLCENSDKLFVCLFHKST